MYYVFYTITRNDHKIKHAYAFGYTVITCYKWRKTIKEKELYTADFQFLKRLCLDPIALVRNWMTWNNVMTHFLLKAKLCSWTFGPTTTDDGRNECHHLHWFPNGWMWLSPLLAHLAEGSWLDICKGAMLTRPMVSIIDGSTWTTSSECAHLALPTFTPTATSTLWACCSAAGTMGVHVRQTILKRTY